MLEKHKYLHKLKDSSIFKKTDSVCKSKIMLFNFNI